MPQLVVSCHSDGSIETLLKDKILDTRKFGHREIERITTIEFDEDEQKFYIVWLAGPCASVKLIESLSVERDAEGNTIFFATYEQAVEHEVRRVNALRLAGHSFV